MEAVGIVVFISVASLASLLLWLVQKAYCKRFPSKPLLVLVLSEPRPGVHEVVPPPQPYCRLLEEYDHQFRSSQMRDVSKEKRADDSWLCPSDDVIFVPTNDRRRSSSKPLSEAPRSATPEYQTLEIYPQLRAETVQNARKDSYRQQLYYDTD